MTSAFIIAKLMRKLIVLTIRTTGPHPTLYG